MAATAATGAIPIPFADAPMMIAEQVALMATICGIYGIDVGKDGLKMLATTGNRSRRGDDRWKNNSNESV